MPDNNFANKIEKHINELDLYVENKKLSNKSFLAKYQLWSNKTYFTAIASVFIIPAPLMVLVFNITPTPSLAVISSVIIFIANMYLLTKGVKKTFSYKSLDEDDKQLISSSIIRFIEKNSKDINKTYIDYLDTCVHLLSNTHIPLLWWNELLAILHPPPPKDQQPKKSDAVLDVKEQLEKLHESAIDATNDNDILEITLKNVKIKKTKKI